MFFFVAVNLLLIGLVHNASGTPCLTKGVCGAVGGVSESVSEKFESSASSASSSFESSTRSVSTSSSSATSFDEAYWVNVFGKCKAISDAEKNCYLKWLATFSDNELAYFTKIADYLTVQEALSDVIVDYTTLQKDIAAAYDFFSTNGIYSVEVDLVSKSDILNEYVSKLSNTLKCVSSGSPLYDILAFSIETDVVSLPCTIGLLNSIVKGQETYFASSATTLSTSGSKASSTTTKSVSSTSTSAAGPSVSVDQYKTILEAANIQAAESQLYLSYLSKLSSDKLCMFTDLIDFLNKDTQVLTAEMVLDFATLDQVVNNVYQTLAAQEFFVANADWLAKEAALASVKSQLSSALSCLSKDCCLHKALAYCLEQDLSSLPLVVGLSSYLVQQQSQFFASGSCSSVSSTVSESASSSVQTSSSAAASAVCIS